VCRQGSTIATQAAGNRGVFQVAPDDNWHLFWNADGRGNTPVLLVFTG
jgi:hypothetical protein